jgi:hypothetical protein
MELNSYSLISYIIQLKMIRHFLMLLSGCQQAVGHTDEYFMCTSNSVGGSEDEGKVVPVLNSAPRQADVWESGGISPHILNLGTRLR